VASKTPDHVVTLRYSKKKDSYTASYQEGREHLAGAGLTPELAMEALLEKLGGDEELEMNARMVLSVMFKAWLSRLAREHAIPIEAPNLEVVKNEKRIVTPSEHILEK
jgi:hypothetical protein